MEPDERQDWQAYRDRQDPEAHRRLCERYLPTVRRIVGRMAIYLGDGAADHDDLIQAGAIGLIHAIERFDPAKETDFADFARKRIRGAVYDELRALDGFSSRTRRQQKTLERVRQELLQRLLRTPSEEETAEALGITLEQFRVLQTGVQTKRTVFADPGPDGGDPAEPVQGRSREWTPDHDGLSPAEKMQIVASAIDLLPERTRVVLGLYYRDGLTLKEIAQILELTESRICQIHAAALEALHKQLCDLGAIFAAS